MGPLGKVASSVRKFYRTHEEWFHLIFSGSGSHFVYGIVGAPRGVAEEGRMRGTGQVTGVACVLRYGLVLVLIGTGCTAVPLLGPREPEPELALIYNPAAHYHGPDRNPIIVIPGLLGTRLVDQATGALAWGAFEASAAGTDPDGLRLLALPVRDDIPVEELMDGLEPDGVLEQIRIRLAGIPIEIEAYARILATLGAGGYRDEALGLGGEIDYGPGHFTCFQFDYDWRLDNVANAQRLAAFIQEKRAYVQEEYRKLYGVDDAEVKFDIAAHSMGGLVTRWFLRYGAQGLGPNGEPPELTWEGAHFVERAILVATPNAGSVQAFEDLVSGNQLAPLLPVYPPALIGTFPSAYQLLPRSRHRVVVWDGDRDRPVDLMDPALWERMGWGLASPGEAGILEALLPGIEEPAERRRIALALQRRMLARAAAVHAVLDTPVQTPEGLALHLVAGDAAETASLVSVSSSDGRVKVIEHGPGDGTVLRSSALLDERVAEGWTPWLKTPIDWSHVLFLPNDHLGLTRSATFRDNVLYWLLEAPRATREQVP